MLHPHQEYGKQVLEMVQSLQEAVDQAGGMIISNKEMEEMTLKEFILLMASSGVRFVWKKPRDATTSHQ